MRAAMRRPLITLLFVAAAAFALAATAAAAAAAAAAMPDAAAAQAPGLAGMRLDGSTPEGHAVLLEFEARQREPVDGQAAGVPPERPVLKRGWARMESGLYRLGSGGDADVMVTGGGTIAVHSHDRPAVVIAAPVGGGDAGGAGVGMYRVTVYVPRDGRMEGAVFEAVLGKAGSGAGGPGGLEPGVDPAAPAAGEGGGSGAGADGGGSPSPAETVMALTVTDRISLGGALVVQGRVYDASLNDDPRVVPRGPGAVPDVSVRITVTDKRTGEVVMDATETTDSSGLFRAAHRWNDADPAGAFDVAVSAEGGGGGAEKRTVFYQGR